MTILFRQLFDSDTSTYTYLLADIKSRDAVLIDSVYEQHERDLALIQELGLTLISSVDTHCHADHVTGAWLMKHKLNSKLVASAHSGIEGLDDRLEDGDSIDFGEQALEVIATPGHTDGCISLVLAGHRMVFTGDCLLIRGCGRTDFQQGSALKLFNSIKNRLFELPDDCLVYPGHDYSGRMVSSIGEEKQFNPRIGGQANETDFVGYMDSMNLPHPGRLDIAVPANLKAGRPDNDQIPTPPDWAPVVTTFSGIQEIKPDWVAAHLDEVVVLDVRTQAERDEELAGVKGSTFIPLDELRDRLDEIPRSKPVVTLCRSGRRSVMAFNILRDNGWTRIANISGGLLGWSDDGLPLDKS